MQEKCFYKNDQFNLNAFLPSLFLPLCSTQRSPLLFLVVVLPPSLPFLPSFFPPSPFDIETRKWKNGASAMPRCAVSVTAARTILSAWRLRDSAKVGLSWLITKEESFHTTYNPDINGLQMKRQHGLVKHVAHLCEGTANQRLPRQQRSVRSSSSR